MRKLLPIAMVFAGIWVGGLLLRASIMYLARD